MEFTPERNPARDLRDSPHVWALRRSVPALVVLAVCIPSLTSCVLKNASSIARDSLRASVETFAARLPEVVKSPLNEDSAMKRISDHQLAVFHPEQVTGWFTSGVPQIYDFTASGSRLTMAALFTGNGQVGGGITEDQATYFLCASITLQDEKATLADVDCPAEAIASITPEAVEVSLSDVGVRTQPEQQPR